MCEWGIGLSWVGSGPAASRLPTYQALTSALAASEHRIAPIVVGDLNDVPDSADIRAITGKEPNVELAMVLVDTWERVHGPGGGWTADNLANPLLRGGTAGRRRIDYILTGISYAFQRLWRANDVTVFGTSSGSGVPPSDHYGVHADLELVGPRYRPSDNHFIDR
jgi:endonuclease/exonuclease/phosphatase family metal-dependent hydrolase